MSRVTLSDRLRSRLLPLVVAGVCIGINSLGFWIYSQSNATWTFPREWYITTVTVTVSGFVFPAVGGLVAFRQPTNRIGWLMLLGGLTVSWWTFADNYSGRALELGPGGPPLGEWAGWTGLWIDEIALVWLAMFPLLFPSGTLPSHRWSAVLAVVLAGIILSFIGDAFRPGPFPSGYLSGVMNPAGIDDLGEYSSTVWKVGRALLYVGVTSAIVSLFFRMMRSSGDQLQQIKWVFLSYSLASLTFISMLMVPPATTGNYLFPLIFAITLNTLPVAMAIAVLKYHLYEIDLLINRAFMFGALSAILAGIYAGSVQLARLSFEEAAGLQTTEAGLVGGTIIFAAMFLPLKNRVQAVVDKYYGPAPSRELLSHNERLRSMIKVLDPKENAEEFLNEAVHALGASGGAVFLHDRHQTRCIAVTVPPHEHEAIRVPMRNGADEIGFLVLGPRPDGMEYGDPDLRTLQSSADLVGRAIVLSTASPAGMGLRA